MIILLTLIACIVFYIGKKLDEKGQKELGSFLMIIGVFQLLGEFSLLL